MVENGESVSQTLRWLSQGPSPFVGKHSGYRVNDFYFVTRDRDENRVTQNSGVSVVATTMQLASAKDNRPVISDMSFYGVLDEIWELDYYMFSHILFKCSWVKNNGGVRADDLGFTLVDLNRVGHKSDPFILASQAKQVFYVPDLVKPKWSVVCFMPQRGSLKMKNEDDMGLPKVHVLVTIELPKVNSTTNGDENEKSYARDTNEGIFC